MSKVIERKHLTIPVGVGLTLLLLGSPSAQAQTCVQLPSGAVSWWPGDSGFATDIVDGNPGAMSGGASFSTGHVQQAFSFDGVDDLVYVPPAANLDSPELTVDAWLFRTDNSPTMHILGNRTHCLPSSSQRYQLVIVPGGGLAWGGVSNDAVSSGVDLPLNTWTHVAATADGTSFRIYINGQLAAAGGSGVLGTSGQEFRIAASGNCSDTFGGLIDEVGLFSRALSPCEIKAIYDAGSQGKCKGDTDLDGAVDYLDNCPTVANASQANVDGDLAGDPCDCALNDPAASALPGEAGLLQLGMFGNKNRLDWCSAEFSAGPGTRYDVLRGALDEFPVGTGASEFCVAVAITEPMTSDSDVPAGGEGFWYLVRSRNLCGVGSYGFRSNGAERMSSACP